MGRLISTVHDCRRHLPDHPRLHPSPFAVATQVGFSGAFWLNLLFWLLSFGALGLPFMAVMWPVAVIHAIYIIVTRK